MKRLKTLQAQTQSQSLSSKLQKLRLNIYKPYKSLLKSQEQLLNQQKDQNVQQVQHSTSSLMQNNHSLQLKYKNKKLDPSGMDNLFKSRKTVKLPSIMKNKSISNNNQNKNIFAIADLVPDPLLNGRIKSQRQKVFAQMKANSNQYTFLKIVQRQQLQFLGHCHHRRYPLAEELISRLLNYSIDLNVIDQLCFTLKILADFNLQSLQFEKAFFYFNEGRKCGLFSGQFQLMIQCLIKLAICTSKAGLFPQCIRILKKALQYSWYYNLVNLEFQIYDQIGKNYYIMGDAQKAKNFHYKFFTGQTQSKNSSIRLLSYQSLVLEGLKQMKIHRTISTVFLWMIQIPVKNCDTLQQYLYQDRQNKKQRRIQSPRKEYKKDMKYFSQFRTVDKAVLKLFQQDLFKNQLGQMHYNNSDWTSPIRNKKFISLDIQRNNLLKDKGIEYKDYFSKEKRTPNIKVKNSVEKARKIKTQADIPNQQQSNNSKNQQKWFAFIASQAIKKYRNRQLSNKVNIRGIDKRSQAGITIFRIIYNQYFDFTMKYKAQQVK